jgi:hypothetical protein
MPVAADDCGLACRGFGTVVDDERERFAGERLVVVFGLHRATEPEGAQSETDEQAT